MSIFSILNRKSDRTFYNELHESLAAEVSNFQFLVDDYNSKKKLAQLLIRGEKPKRLVSDVLKLRSLASGGWNKDARTAFYDEKTLSIIEQLIDEEDNILKNPLGELVLKELRTLRRELYSLREVLRREVELLNQLTNADFHAKALLFLGSLKEEGRILGLAEGELPIINGHIQRFINEGKDITGVGLYQLNMAVPHINQSDVLYVLVHPFFGDVHPYIDNVRQLIHSTPYPILTLDAWLSVTIPDFEELNPKGERFFMQNGGSYAVPKCGWEITAEVINAFKPKRVIFGGSLLFWSPVYGYQNCVGLTFNNLRDAVPNATLDKSICDIRN